MNSKQIAALALIACIVPVAADARGGAGRGMGGARVSGGARVPSSGSRTAPSARTAPSGGFDFPNDGGGTRTITTPGGGTHSTTINSSGGTYTKNSSTNTQYGTTHSTNTSVNPSTGNYSRNTSGSNQSGTYSSSASGNASNKTYSRTTTATNAYGQTYHGGTAVNNGYVYHGAVVTNPIYHGYPVWGWNAGVIWYPAPYYWGGGFWGALALGTAAAITYGAVTAESNETVTSYEVKPDSPGAKLLASYGLTQTPCGPPSLVVIYGPNNSVICAKPNQAVSAGNYSVDSSTLTIVSEKA